MDLQRARQLMKELEQYDSGTIANVVAGYPQRETYCLGIYDPWSVNWYTDNSLQNLFPQKGARVGFAATCIQTLPTPGFKGLSMNDFLKRISLTPSPVIAVIQVQLPEALMGRAATIGGNIMTAARTLGVVGCITNGQGRDVAELDEVGVVCMTAGLSPAHGDMIVSAVNVPVTVGQMDVMPGDIIHMDVSGAVKFPACYLEEVAARCRLLCDYEADYQARMRSAGSFEELMAARNVDVRTLK